MTTLPRAQTVTSHEPVWLDIGPREGGITCTDISFLLDSLTLSEAGHVFPEQLRGECPSLGRFQHEETMPVHFDLTTFEAYMERRRRRKAFAALPTLADLHLDVPSASNNLGVALPLSSKQLHRMQEAMSIAQSSKGNWAITLALENDVRFTNGGQHELVEPTTPHTDGRVMETLISTTLEGNTVRAWVTVTLRPGHPTFMTDKFDLKALLDLQTTYR